MSEVTEDQVEKMQKQLNQFQEQLELAKQSKDRMLEESKSWKSKFQEANAKLEEKETADLESKEEWKELLDKTKNEKFHLENDLKTARKRNLQQKINFEVARYAGNAHDVNDVISALDENLLSVENDDVLGIEEAVKKLKGEKSYLFDTKRPGTVTKRPGDMLPEDKSWSQMTETEKDSLFKKSVASLLE